MRLKLTHERLSHACTLPDDVSIGDLAKAAIDAFKLPIALTQRVRIRSGFPPTEIAVVDVNNPSSCAQSATESGIKSGSVVDIRIEQSAPPPVTNDLTTSRVTSVSPPQGLEVGPTAPTLMPSAVIAEPKQWSCSACTFINAAGKGDCEMCGTARPATIARHVVPADNSCLFTALSYLTGGGMGGGQAMRARIASHILGNPTEFDEGVLGQAPAAYAAYIRRPEIWGGGIEMSAASSMLGMEVVAVNVMSAGLSRFGEDKSYPRRIFLIYDGIHFDALHRPGSAPATVFDAGDSEAEAQAVALAQEARSQRAFTDLASFALICGVCGKGMTGQKAALEHAGATGHANFSECPRDIAHTKAMGT